MNETISYIYKCYLGRHLLFRTAMIHEFVKAYGAEFFLKYSTETDTILDFIRKCEDKGLL